ncbi:LacI family DNA-binding transcriptional regulator [Modestobacter sp. NPDC049651]|uniref:LacI family DNA-binding transcriptional regulator n=1 Tax=unclassified Modestobacter TaxID=2643866 RepID=UPI0033C53203
MRDDAAVTLVDVARRAGLSRATVSRALTGSGPVADETRRRALAAAAELGYAADPVARAMVTGAGTRLVVAVTGAAPTVLTDPYLARVVGAAARVADADGLGVAARWLPLDRPGEALRQLGADRTVAGVVLVNTTQAVLGSVPPALRRRTVSIGVGGGVLPAYDVDNDAAVAGLARHLVRSGRRRIAMLTGPPWLPCTRRPVAAYRRVVAEAGLPARTVPGDFDAASGRTGVAEVLRRWPGTDAVLAVSDAVALGALAALRERGRQVPGDVAVAGFDDVPAAWASGPPLTTATHPVEEIAAAAARGALGRPDVVDTWFGSEVVVRASA